MNDRGASSCDPINQVVDLPTGRLEVTLSADSLETDIDRLIGFGARDNARRGYLFVSRVLGKHIPVSPSLMRTVHEALAATVPAGNGSETVFVGMAETATGLGFGVFEAFRRSHPTGRSLYVHTTRYWIDSDALTFEESHSHAPDLCLHAALDPLVRERQATAKNLVLIDDELSTGRTFANLIRVYQQHYPSVERIHVATICDFSDGQATEVIQAATSAPVSVGALLVGRHTFSSTGTGQATPRTTAQPGRHSYPRLTGSFGRRPVTGPMAIGAAAGASKVRELAATARRIRVVGTGEFMHSAYALGAWLETSGHQVDVQSTTRSPILPGIGAITAVTAVPDHYGEGVPNYLYNDFPDSYDLTLICCEGHARAESRGIAHALGGRLVEFLDRGGDLELSLL